MPKPIKNLRWRGKYPVRDGIPIFLGSLPDFKAQEKRLAEFEARRYQIDEEKKWFPNLTVYENALRPILQLPAGSTVLELGSGVSYTAPLAIRTGLNLTISDIALSVLKRTRQYLRRCRLTNQATFIVFDAERIPFRNSSFSACYMISSFHHLPDQIKALKEIKRVTKNNGLIILVAEPNSWPYRTLYPLTSPIRSWLRKRTRRRYDSIADEITSGFSRQDLVTLFTSQGIKIESIIPTLFLTQFYAHFLILLNRLLKLNLARKQAPESFLNGIDDFLAKMPLINNLFWHWSIIGRVKK